MTFKRALEALEARQEARIELGLGRVREHLRRLGNPEAGLPCLHVAGTNGKGSVSAMLASALAAAGHRTGLYTSPHLSSVLDRITIDGRRIPEAAFARLLGRAFDADREGRLTYFELLTSVAFQWFAENEAGAAVLETGLGGRLDATNAIGRALVSIITSISRDHVQFLGSTLAAIAGEKAGIIKPGCPVVCPPLPKAAMRVVRARAKEVGAELTVVERPFKTVGAEWARQRLVLEDPAGGRFSLGLLGLLQPMNAAVARAALDKLSAVLPVPEEAWRRGLEGVRWPGRFEVRRLEGRTAVLDGAHNVEAARCLSRTWAASPWAQRPARWIMGLMRDKDAAGIIKALSPHLREVVAVRAPSPRALSAEELAALLRRHAPRAVVAAEPEGERALGAWLKDGPKTAVVCGSFYLVGLAGRFLSGGRRGG